MIVTPRLGLDVLLPYSQPCIHVSSHDITELDLSGQKVFAGAVSTLHDGPIRPSRSQETSGTLEARGATATATS